MLNRNVYSHASAAPRPAFTQDNDPTAGRISCDWAALKQQILLQWGRVEPAEVEEAGPDRKRLARLIQRRHGIAAELVENYLRNFERTLPLMPAH